jgi:hypothetical protein
MDFVSDEESQYWKKKNNEFICKALKKLCGKEFNDSPIIINSLECFAGTNKKYFVSLDISHDITHVFDANQENYEIPAVKVLLDEREECFRKITETKPLLTNIQNETYHLENIRHLDVLIDVLYKVNIDKLPKLRETIEINQERIKNIKKELTKVFADFLRKHD